MAYEDLPWWYRSSPYVGALGGLLVAAQFHLLGPTWRDGLFGISIADELVAMFDASPLLGYVAFVLVGAGLGWVFRELERWGHG